MSRGWSSEVVESVRKGDMLTVRVRFRDAGTTPANVSLASGGKSYHTANYIVAGNTEYDIRRDVAGNVLATPRDGGGWLEPTIRPKATFAWWANSRSSACCAESVYAVPERGPPIDGVYQSSTANETEACRVARRAVVDRCGDQIDQPQ